MISSRRRFIKIVAAQSAALAAATQSPLLGSAHSTKLRQWRGIVLGAEAIIQLNCETQDKTDRVLARCVSEIQILESIFSLYDERSSLSRLNQQKSLSQPPVELVELLQIAKKVGYTTNGIFDVTIHPIITAYQDHFATSQTGLPSNLDKAKATVDFRKIEIKNDQIRLKNPHAAITLNGIAQGFITDKITALLKKEGIGHTLIDLGEKRAIGKHPTGRNWQLGLSNKSGIHDVVELNNTALSSSGGYGTTFDTKGIHHHLIDPRTGLSVNHHASVHVVANSATIADALSTALSTCKRDEALDIEQSFPEARVFRS